MTCQPLYHLPVAMSFDMLDSQLTNVKGGEVVGLTYVAGKLQGGSELAAADVADGYVSFSKKTEPTATLSLVSGIRPLFLVDDGVAGYGTLFGQTVGGTAGQQVVGSALGPHSARGSGKVTCWDGPGIFSISLDAVDTSGANGLTPTNPGLSGNQALYATVNGILTPNSALQFENIVVGRFLEFATNGSKVSTPPNLAGAANAFTQAIVRFSVET